MPIPIEFFKILHFVSTLFAGKFVSEDDDQVAERVFSAVVAETKTPQSPKISRMH
jgi:hypothetical protein